METTVTLLGSAQPNHLEVVVEEHVTSVVKKVILLVSVPSQVQVMAEHATNVERKAISLASALALAVEVVVAEHATNVEKKVILPVSVPVQAAEAVVVAEHATNVVRKATLPESAPLVVEVEEAAVVQDATSVEKKDTLLGNVLTMKGKTVSAKNNSIKNSV